jgi:DNA-3-methyladenine glycosylase I
MNDSNLYRCEWSLGNDLMIAYHDTEWGVPVRDDTKLFEYVVLDGAQAGLSWNTILQRREGYRRAFDDYDIEKIIGYDDAKIASLLEDTGIIRNRLKVNSVVTNARCLIEVKAEFGSFSNYLWSFVSGETIRNAWQSMADVPATTQESDAMSKDMKKRGFKFVGSTICYAFMQSAGMVNDHRVDCFRYNEV